MLLSDIIRTLSQLGDLENTRITLIEPSENLRSIQQQKILPSLHKHARVFPKYETRLSNTSKGRKETFSDAKRNFTLDWYDSVESFMAELTSKLQ